MEALFRCESWIAIVMITDVLARKYRFNVPGTKANLIDAADAALDCTARFSAARAGANE